MWPNQRKTGSGALRGDFCRLGGGVGMLSGDKRLRVWATLLEECMSGPETERSSSEAKSRSARPATWSPNNNDEHRAPQTALGASFAACTARWYVYSFMCG